MATPEYRTLYATRMTALNKLMADVLGLPYSVVETAYLREKNLKNGASDAPSQNPEDMETLSDSLSNENLLGLDTPRHLETFGWGEQSGLFYLRHRSETTE